jgi:hypothetical protein
MSMFSSKVEEKDMDMSRILVQNEILEFIP